MNNESAKGALFGLAVGDALGTTLEFSNPGVKPFSEHLTGPHRDVTGGGPFSVEPGQVTDDTMMAVCLARSLMDVGGLDDTDLAQRYARWGAVSFDVGSQTRQCLTALQSSNYMTDSGRLVWVRGGKNAAGNGSLMRTAPIGVHFAGSLPMIAEASLADSALTHFDPRCALACAAYNSAIGLAVEYRDSNETATSSRMMAEALRGLYYAAGMYSERNTEDREEIDTALDDLATDLSYATKEDPDLYDAISITGTQGFVRVAFRLAFWQLMHATSYSEGLIDTVNRGGDADTNGAIVGGLLGALFGTKGESGIPEAWVTKVMSCDPTKRGGVFGKSGIYHPSFFLDFAD